MTPAGDWLPLLHLGATLALVGVLWVVQVAVYPLFDALAPADFPAYHHRYTRRITLVVAPLMVAEGLTALLLWLGGLRGPLAVAAAVLLLLIWLSTFALQVPLHLRLDRGYDAAAHRRLVATNWIRTLAWTARGVLLLAAWSAR